MGEVGVIVIFVFLGIMLSLGKFSFLIAGFNTLTKEEKEKYDVKSLCKFMGKIMFLIAFSVALPLIGEKYNIEGMIYLTPICIVGLVIFAVFYANTGNRFENKVEERKKTKIKDEDK